MASYLLLQPLSSVCFGGKIQFSASQDLSFARSKYFKIEETESPGHVWSIKPPDFSLKLYSSLSVPQKIERRKDSNQSIPQPSEAKRISGVYLPDVLRESNKRKEPPKFITSYRPPGALESELMFVRTGKYPSEPYKNPKPHDFRPCEPLDPSQVFTRQSQSWTHINLQSLSGMQSSYFLSCHGLQNLLLTHDTGEEEEHTVHSWTVWKRNSQDPGKIDRDSFFLNTHFISFSSAAVYASFLSVM
ncbi:putative uncharacterized protein C7orf78 homolog [Mastacembelus armatus]|uniref:putative uncharacterized protein C7orf78 homolog n=1 Tax=Mastacembelus armatus TaxID=205130 RepID=UPI000E45D47D|nr:uncharacterized protein LOC113136632 [Mastacembelus armatus]